MTFARHLLYSIGFLLMACNSGTTHVGGVEQALSDTADVKTGFTKYFINCNVTGSIAIYDYQAKRWILSNTSGVYRETLPASTFKIINLLIALETGVIKSEKEIVKWNNKADTVKYGYRPEIYHDMTVEEAFDVSAGWVFAELAKKIGKKNYRRYLAACNYGNQDLSNKDDDFWNFGALGISPVGQVNFLRRLYDYDLPFSKKNIDIVKEVMVTEEGQHYTIRAKTGWTRDGNINTGWWVGYVENDRGVYFFATRLLQDRRFKTAGFGACRKEITKKVLEDLDIIIGE